MDVRRVLKRFNVAWETCCEQFIGSRCRKRCHRLSECSPGRATRSPRQANDGYGRHHERADSSWSRSEVQRLQQGLTGKEMNQLLGNLNKSVVHNCIWMKTGKYKTSKEKRKALLMSCNFYLFQSLNRSGLCEIGGRDNIQPIISPGQTPIKGSNNKRVVTGMIDMVEIKLLILYWYFEAQPNALRERYRHFSAPS